MALEFGLLVPINPLEGVLANYMSTSKQLWGILTKGDFLGYRAYKDVMELEVVTQVDFDRQLFGRFATVFGDNLTDFSQFRDRIDTCFDCFEQRRLNIEVLHGTKVSDELLPYCFRVKPQQMVTG